MKIIINKWFDRFILMIILLSTARLIADTFDKGEQERLSKVFKELDKKGCYVMLSNYNTNLVNHLYKGYNFTIVEAPRNIGAAPKIEVQ